MPLARTLAVSVVGVDGHLVEVEADLAQGLPGMVLVGLPDTALSEARDRVRAAVLNSGARWPQQRLTVNLSPAALPKRGASFDLALAVAVLAATGEVPAAALVGRVLLGELGLDGRLRAVPGVLPAVLAAAAAGVLEVVVPAENALEASLVPGVVVRGRTCLAAVLRLLRGEPESAGDSEAPPVPESVADTATLLDIADVAGQPEARWAVEVAAAGGHHLLLLGSPGVGKTMLAERLPGLLPDLDRTAALEVTAVHSVAGRLPAGVPLLRRPPFQAPHSTATPAALVGGGSGSLRPGAASLAHRGVLFLDEAPEFAPTALDALRQSLESGWIVVQRASAQASWPARFQLVLAANPCPCGYARGKGRVTVRCSCAPQAVRRYAGRLSGPLLDRVDVRCMLASPTKAELRLDLGTGEATATVAARVAAARGRAAVRLAGTPWRTNAEVPGPQLRRGAFALPRRALVRPEEALDRGLLTARGVDRVLRLAWTLADLEGTPRPDAGHVAAALALRDAA